MFQDGCVADAADNPNQPVNISQWFCHMEIFYLRLILGWKYSSENILLVARWKASFFQLKGQLVNPGTSVHTSIHNIILCIDTKKYYQYVFE